MSNTIITLDGPAGVGKSSLARSLAQQKGLPFLDTGAMFRCIALHFGEQGLTLTQAELATRLNELQFSLQGVGDSSTLLCNGKAPGNEIRTETIAALASKYAAMPAVREYTTQCQQEIGRHFSLVAEGRDTGTVIFPTASNKFFLDASTKVRALRRQKQLAEQGRNEDLAALEQQIQARDEQDRNRPIAPLKAAPDAVVIDTSNLNMQEVLAEILKRL
ncbi:(d)CMP kinase [Desulfovibrio sp. OttesenSCG-928-F07]|nr:(d)CMP kinase [Desulfovibrio sp. OttesenSCG-928-F07]